MHGADLEQMSTLKCAEGLSQNYSNKVMLNKVKENQSWIKVGVIL